MLNIYLCIYFLYYIGIKMFKVWKDVLLYEIMKNISKFVLDHVYTIVNTVARPLTLMEF